MKIRLLLYGLVIISYINGSSISDLDSLKRGLHFFRLKKVEVQLNQFQYGQIYNSNLSVSFIDSTQYLIESDEQDIFISGNNIKTINKRTNQLIIDERLSAEKDIFYILRGDLTGIELKNKRNEKGVITFSFTMSDIGMEGTISVKNENWHFEKLFVDYDKDNWITLKVYSWQILRGSYTFSEFGKDADEVIDLRE